MTIRFAFIGAGIFVAALTPAGAQGRPPQQQVVLSEAVLKSMTANRPKSKTPLTARVGMVRRSSIAAAKKSPAAPTAVREISPTK